MASAPPPVPALGTSVGVTKVDGHEPPFLGIIQVTGGGPWIVEGTATPASGATLTYLAYEYSFFDPAVDISRANLPAWSFELTATDLPLNQVFTFTVTALDNSVPSFGATVAPISVVRTSTTTTPPPPAHA